MSVNTATLTLTSNAGTMVSSTAVCTTPSLSTAAGASQAETITYSGMTATGCVIVSLSGGTNTTVPVILNTVCTTNTITVTVSNGHASAALNGTIIFTVEVINIS